MKNLIYSSLICLAMVLISAAAFTQHIQGTYAIKNTHTGMLLRIKDANRTNGTPIVSYPAVNWKCVTWDFKHVDGQCYQLQNLFTGKTFQSVNATTGSLLQQQPLISKQANQQYEFIPAGQNTFLIRAKGTGLYVTPVDAKGHTNSSVILAEKREDKLQEWTIYEQKPTM